MIKYPKNLTEITTFILDIDGVLTDGTIIIEPTGEQTRTMNIKDGFALQLAVKRGFKVAVISGGRNEIVKKRFAGLGIHDVFMGASDKWEAFEELKLTGGWAGYYDCNRLDNNAVVGKHPKFENVYLATGFTGRGLMQAPGIGRALTELITTGSYQSIDISNMAVERVLGKKARPEPYVL